MRRATIRLESEDNVALTRAVDCLKLRCVHGAVEVESISFEDPCARCGGWLGGGSYHGPGYCVDLSEREAPARIDPPPASLDSRLRKPPPPVSPSGAFPSMVTDHERLPGETEVDFSQRMARVQSREMARRRAQEREVEEPMTKATRVWGHESEAWRERIPDA